MSERWLMLLNTVTRRLLEDQHLMDDPYPLIEELAADGYQHEEVEIALSWVGRFISAPVYGAVWPAEHFTSHGFRTRSAEEQLSFSCEAFGYLMKLENYGLIDPTTREEILERALLTYEEEIGEEEIKLISRIVLTDHGLDLPASTADPLALLEKPRLRNLN